MRHWLRKTFLEPCVKHLEAWLDARSAAAPQESLDEPEHRRVSRQASERGTHRDKLRYIVGHLTRRGAGE
jgi:hypothetical protein